MTANLAMQMGVLWMTSSTTLVVAMVTERQQAILASSPPMGWNSYNHYACNPSQDIIHSNSKALVDLGLRDLGYHYVTTDCGWAAQERAQDGTIQWNSQLFPDGFPALGKYIHRLGLKFGVYSDGGIRMCDNGPPPLASLNHETLDATTFASWGADFLKYDNCFSDADLGYPFVSYAPSESPKPHYQAMSQALAATNRSILFAICDWGVDFPSAWAPALGNTWRITNDIIPAWTTVYRQINQFVPSASFAAPGRWPDLDMLEVGNNVFTQAEEQTQFSLWSICKSPLIIGAALKDPQTSISASSLQILANKHAIGYNQDSLGIAANLTRRYTEEQYDIWAGKLSGGRIVAALVNWADQSRIVQINFPDFGVQFAGSLYDVWQNKSMTNVSTSYTTTVAAHGTVLLELDAVHPAGRYKRQLFAKRHHNVTKFEKVFGLSNSDAYRIKITFAHPAESHIIHVRSSASSARVSITVPKNALNVTGILSLAAGGSNELWISTTAKISHIDVVNPAGTFYPATSFNVFGTAVQQTCSPGTCQPVGAKVGYLEPNGGASISIPRSASSNATTRFVEIVYTNNDVAFSSAFNGGRNARNITVGVNGNVPARLEVPLSGRSSELYSPGRGYYDSATLGLLIAGFGVGPGNDTVVVSNVLGDLGVQFYGADFVGLRIY